MKFEDSGEYFEDEDGHDGRRRRMGHETIQLLMKHYVMNAKPNARERERIAEKVGVTARAVQVWFQNRRAKLKKESNSTDLFSNSTAPRSEHFFEKPSSFPAITTRNFKELCLPNYLNFSIDGPQHSHEEADRNEAIRNYWRLQHEKEEDGDGEGQRQLQKAGKKSRSDEREKQGKGHSNHNRKSRNEGGIGNFEGLSDDGVRRDLNLIDMPELLPFQEISFERYCAQAQFNQMMSTPSFIPQLDHLAMNMDFLFAPITSTSFTSAASAGSEQFMEKQMQLGAGGGQMNDVFSFFQN